MKPSVRVNIIAGRIYAIGMGVLLLILVISYLGLGKLASVTAVPLLAIVAFFWTWLWSGVCGKGHLLFIAALTATLFAGFVPAEAEGARFAKDDPEAIAVFEERIAELKARHGFVKTRSEVSCKSPHQRIRLIHESRIGQYRKDQGELIKEMTSPERFSPGQIQKFIKDIPAEVIAPCPK